MPAVMATQALHDKHQRWLTILLIPFMSCNARVPVFVLLISAFFSQYAATVLFILYLIGISVAAISGLIFSLFFFKRREPIVEITLTPYRVPQLRPTLKKMWAEASDYLKKITNVVLVASAIIWALNAFPLNKEGATEHESYLEQAGKFLSPVFAPLGFDWKMTTALITGVVAKETVVSTLSVLYTGEEDEILLGERLQNEPIFSTPTVAAFLIFILLYFPCIAVVVCIYKVTKNVGFTLLSVCYTTGIAWILAFLTQKISVLFLI
ncbi:hypothetical protein FACS189452_10620 [Bacteroidia bacterium]|nr:hypothetical protein FACS189452_10620 [Bacteroidia bacterium]